MSLDTSPRNLVSLFRAGHRVVVANAIVAGMQRSELMEIMPYLLTAMTAREIACLRYLVRDAEQQVENFLESEK